MNTSIYKIILSFIISFAAGAFPSAYLLVKYTKGSDIRTQGSGNVGAMNSFEVTNSKIIGFSVLLLDLLKAVTAMLISIFLLKISNLRYIDNSVVIIDAVLLVLAHNYNPFLKFKGGRGLSVAAGIFLIVNPLLLLLWLAFWIIAYKSIFDDIINSNIFATVAAFIAVLFVKDFIIDIFYTFIPISAVEYKFLAFCISALIFIKHLNGKDNIE